MTGESQMLSEGHHPAFLYDRKLRSLSYKNPPGDRTAAAGKKPLKRPAAGGESCEAGYFLDNLGNTVS